MSKLVVGSIPKGRLNTNDFTFRCKIMNGYKVSFMYTVFNFYYKMWTYCTYEKDL